MGRVEFVTNDSSDFTMEDVFKSMDKWNHRLVLFKGRKREKGFEWCLKVLRKYGEPKYKIMPKSKGHWYVQSVGQFYVAFNVERNWVQAGIYGNKCIADNLISPTFKQFKKEAEEYFESHKGMAKGEVK